MKYKIAAFFANRNGFDDLSRFILWPGLVVMLISAFIPVAWLSMLLSALAWGCYIYAIVRAFSKKLDKRQSENNAFLRWKNGLKQRWSQRKTHKFYRCPKCRTTLRVPKGKGKISITCRSCGEKFIKQT